MLPAGALGFVNAISSVVLFLLQPEQAAINYALGGLSRASRPDRENAEVKKSQEEAEVYKTRYFEQIADNERLRERIEQLEHTIALDPRAAVRPLVASAIGEQAEGNFKFLSLKAGSSQGIEPGQSVATLRGVYLIGRVVNVDAFSCRVLPITDKNAVGFRAIIIPTEAGEPHELPSDPLEGSIACNLAPTGDGLLAGDVIVEKLSERWSKGDSSKPRPQPAVDMVVRLNDDTWPRTAQMLVVGRIVKVQEKEIGRPRVIVQPMYKTLREISEAIIRSPGKPAGASGGGS